MKFGWKGTVAVSAAALMALSVVPAASAANNPSPAQIAAGYMKAPVKITQRLPLKTKPQAGIKAVFMQAGVPSAVTIYKYLGIAAQSVGWSLTQVPWDSTNPASVNQNLQTALQQGAQLIFAPGLVPSTVSETVKAQIAQANVPVIVGQSCVDTAVAPPFYLGWSLCADQAAPAKALAAWFTADSGGKGKLLLSSMSGFTSFALFQRLFVAEVAKQCPGCSVTVQPVTTTQYATNTLPSVLVSALRKDPSITYLFFDSGQWSRGILSALDAAGLLSTVKVGGRNMDAPSYQALKDRQEVVWTAQGFGTAAYAAMDAALRVVTKSPGISGDAALPVQLVTTVNVGTVPDPYEVVPADSLAQFKRLWRVR